MWLNRYPETPPATPPNCASADARTVATTSTAPPAPRLSYGAVLDTPIRALTLSQPLVVERSNAGEPSSAHTRPNNQTPQSQNEHIWSTPKTQRKNTAFLPKLDLSKPSPFYTGYPDRLRQAYPQGNSLWTPPTHFPQVYQNQPQTYTQVSGTRSNTVTENRNNLASGYSNYSVGDSRNSTVTGNRNNLAACMSTDVRDGGAASAVLTAAQEDEEIEVSATSPLLGTSSRTNRRSVCILLLLICGVGSSFYMHGLYIPLLVSISTVLCNVFINYFYFAGCYFFICQSNLNTNNGVLSIAFVSIQRSFLL